MASTMHPDGIIDIQNARAPGKWFQGHEGAQHLALKQDCVILVGADDRRQAVDEVPRAPQWAFPFAERWIHPGARWGLGDGYAVILQSGNVTLNAYAAGCLRTAGEGDDVQVCIFSGHSSN